MMLIREIMYCKPGKVKGLVEKFKAMNAMGDQMSMPKMRIMTDFSAERFWVVVAEFEVPNLQELEDMMTGKGKFKPEGEAMKKMDEIMVGYHDLVDHGRREIYKLEN